MSSRRHSRKHQAPHLYIFPTLDSPSSHGHPESSIQSLPGSESLTIKNDARSLTWNKRAGRNRLGQNPVTTTDWRNVGRKTIDILFDDVLLGIFDFLVVESTALNGFEAEDWWRTLVHVCRKWRNVIFGSTHRLNLRLLCSDKTRVRETLDIWPPFPIALCHFSLPQSSGDNIIAALERNDRVCQITLKLDPVILNAMQKPFPALTHLALLCEIDRVIPDSFVGGSAPRLQDLRLEGVQFPGLPTLLLSATDLVHLILCRIPHSGYTSPEEIVTCISTLSRLEALYLGFESPRSRPNRESRRPSQHSPTRYVLPALVILHFTGVSEYLEDLVDQIDCPLLDRFGITLFPQLVFDTPQLIQFISRTPTLKVYGRACVDFSDLHVRVTFSKKSSNFYHLTLKILCRWPGQLSSIAQISTSFFPRSLIHMVERLYICKKGVLTLKWKDRIEDSKWLELLYPFTAVKDLFPSREFAPRIASSLQKLVGRRRTEVLPALQRLLLEERPTSGPFKEAVGEFAAARELSNHPVAICRGMFITK